MLDVEHIDRLPLLPGPFNRRWSLLGLFLKIARHSLGKMGFFLVMLGGRVQVPLAELARFSVTRVEDNFFPSFAWASNWAGILSGQSLPNLFVTFIEIPVIPSSQSPANLLELIFTSGSFKF